MTMKPINLREIASLPTHGPDGGIPYVAIKPKERDALVAAARMLQEVCDRTRKIAWGPEDLKLWMRADEAADRFVDEEPPIVKDRYEGTDYQSGIDKIRDEVRRLNTDEEPTDRPKPKTPTWDGGYDEIASRFIDEEPTDE